MFWDNQIDVSLATGEFSQAIAELSTSDVGKQLTGALSGLAEVEKKAQELQNVQAREDVVTIMSTGNETLSLISPFSPWSEGEKVVER